MVDGVIRQIYVSPDAQLKYMKPGKSGFDADLIRIAECFVSSDSVVWDIGANVGFFTFAAASLVQEGVVVSVEADVWLAGLLRRSTRLPEFSSRDIRILPVAVSHEDGVAVFHIAGRGRASNSLAEGGGRSQMGGVREIQYVPSLCMDTMLKSLPPPDFVKIDVEGAEAIVLKGALKMLQDIRPVVYVEVGHDTHADVSRIFSDASYMPFSISGNDSVKGDQNLFYFPVENESSFRDSVSGLRLETR